MEVKQTEDQFWNTAGELSYKNIFPRHFLILKYDLKYADKKNKLSLFFNCIKSLQNSFDTVLT